MGWDLDLHTKDADGQWHNCGSWNYTHNCNEMISTALEDARVLDEPLEKYWAPQLGRCWFDLFHDHSARDTAVFLAAVIGRFEGNPDKYKSMNPKNGWGSYETLLLVLKEMHEAALKYPSAEWSLSA